MGLIGQIVGMLFGSNRNVVAETVEVFRENAERGAVRDATKQTAALTQFATEFGQSQRGAFDSFIDGLNRLPRPMLSLGTVALFAAAMFDPAWFGVRMQGLALVPEPLWWLMGAIVSFYFGARYQVKGQEFQAKIAQAVAEATPASKSAVAPQMDVHDNAALSDWQAQNDRP